MSRGLAWGSQQGLEHTHPLRACFSSLCTSNHSRSFIGHNFPRKGLLLFYEGLPQALHQGLICTLILRGVVSSTYITIISQHDFSHFVRKLSWCIQRLHIFHFAMSYLDLPQGLMCTNSEPYGFMVGSRLTTWAWTWWCEPVTLLWYKSLILRLSYLF